MKRPMAIQLQEARLCEQVTYTMTATFFCLSFVCHLPHILAYIFPGHLHEFNLDHSIFLILRIFSTIHEFVYFAMS